MMQNTKLNTIIDTVVTSTDRNLMAKSVGWLSLHLAIEEGPETMASITFGTYHGDDRQLRISSTVGCFRQRLLYLHDA